MFTQLNEQVTPMCHTGLTDNNVVTSPSMYRMQVTLQNAAASLHKGDNQSVYKRCLREADLVIAIVVKMLN